ncbi:hypothetical protein H310_14808 [Aphanomyces invadans]|uniref:Uncharacterized protein n=1 Tax=Aphanomyces invadans TaxID=157072 RepID=A0A024T8I2_9STRA|nr:hypothetical protein H310_14808 [Aphanomyces invadans]ETV90405.1 hypothetical protein H310_14808 [Aphanomyces invadans]|eukprot:XP_008880961.1 hypothetical protein H310_14808 [Aphanomyces invadans]
MEYRTIVELVLAVQTSFSALSTAKLEKTFGKLDRVMRAIVEAKGGNTYKIPRSKERVEDKIDEDVMASLQLMNLRFF